MIVGGFNIAAIVMILSVVPVLNSAAESEMAEPSETGFQKYERYADKLHDSVSERILTSANWLDSFFAAERAEIEENRTSFKLWFPLFIEEGENIDIKPRARFRLILPQLSDNFQLILSGDAEDKTIKQKFPETGRLSTPEDAGDRKFSAAMRYFFESTRENNLSLKLGLRIEEFLPVAYLEPRYSKEIDVDPWVFRFTQSVKWASRHGFEIRTLFDFERPLYDKLFFRTSAEGNWFEDELGYYGNLRFVLFQPLDARKALEYLWSNNFVTRPSYRLDEVILSVRYRQRIWRDWVSVEIAPQVAFPSDHDFDITPGILFGIEILFGGL